MSDQPPPKSQETRITRVESAVRHLQEWNEDFSRQVSSRFDGVSQGLAALSAKIDTMGDRNRITMPLILSAIGTVISVAVVAGVIHSQSLKPLLIESQNTRRILEAHMATGGHTDTLMSTARDDERIKELRREIDELKSKVK